ncbi:MAG: 30S ribosomal protein THX [Bacteroidota bacterium]|jgi:30S ribosomal protein S31|nr:30S ribosomal protein THX [Bacteroidota bacterium]MCA6445011.1 30S ribosomal protein THX [Bacteroidota bacterium]
MGKGDKKTKRGKIHIGTSGVTRPKKKKKPVKKAEAKKAAPKKAAKKAK